MNKFFLKFRDTLIAGIIFLLPVLVILVLMTKLLGMITGFTSKLAALFGLKALWGLSGTTLIGIGSLLIFCLVCGYLVRITFFSSISLWIDQKLMQLLPPYRVYREMAMSKLMEKEAAVPYQSAAWIKQEDGFVPAFLMAEEQDKSLLFIPTAGNVKEGSLIWLPNTNVLLDKEADMTKFRNDIAALGIGMKLPKG